MPTPSWRLIWHALPALTPLARDVFDGATAERRLAAFFGVATSESFGAFSRVELTAAAAAVTYIERTQLGKRPPLSPPVREAAGATLSIDQATRSNLELIRTISGERRGSLLSAIDRTITAAGSRLLAQRLAAPLTDPAEIAHRLDAVAAFVDDSGARNDLRQSLKAVPDLARALSRIVVGRGGPRDLAAIRDGILAAAEFSARLAALANVPRDLAHGRRVLAPARCRPRRRAWTSAGRRAAGVPPRWRLRARGLRACARRSARAARRIPPRHRRPAGALRRDHRRALAENPAQQRARLFRRRHRAERRKADERAAQRDLHPSADHRRAGALHHDRTRRAGSEDRQRRRPRARHRT